MTNLVTSPAGRLAIMQREGCKLTAYQDSVGVWTIGVGHTGRASPPMVYEGMTINNATAEAYLAADLTPFENVVNASVKVPISQNAFDALVSLSFNIGARGFQGSSVLRQLNLGRYEVAADDFRMWEIPPELKSRREGERAQFLRPDA